MGKILCLQSSRLDDSSCTFNKYHETKGVFYRHICSSCFTQDAKVSTHSASDCKISVNRLTLGIVKRAHLQPDHVQEDLLHISKNNATFVHRNVGKIVNKQYPCRFVYSQSGSDLNILKQEMWATRGRTG